MASAHVACRSSRRQKESKRCAVYSAFKVQMREKRKPSLSMPKSEGFDNL